MSSSESSDTESWSVFSEAEDEAQGIRADEAR